MTFLIKKKIFKLNYVMTSTIIALSLAGGTLGCSKNAAKPDVEFIAKKKSTPDRSSQVEPVGKKEDLGDRSTARKPPTKNTDLNQNIKDKEKDKDVVESTNSSQGTSQGATDNRSTQSTTTSSNTNNSQSTNQGSSTTSTSSTSSNDNSSTTENELGFKDYGKDATSADIQKWVAADKLKRGASAANYRYAFIPNSFLKDKKNANYARVGLSKALNSVAIAAKEIHNPEDVSDGHGIVFGFDTTKYWGNQAAQKWAIVAGARAKRLFAGAPNLDLQAFDGNKAVSADRLSYNLLHGGVYNQLIDTEARGSVQKRKISAGKVTHRMAIKNAITIGPRYTQRREMPNGKAYWESFDQFFGRRGMEVPYISSNRLPEFRGDGMLADFGVVASESWNHMDNGLIAYYIWGNANQERSKAEQAFVVDPLNHKGGDLVNGFCVFCHISGVQAAPSDIPTAIAEGRVSGQHASRLKEYFTSQSDLSDIYAKDRKVFTDAMTVIVNGMSDGDKKFNDGLASGADTREPTYFLVSKLTKSNLDGVVRGNDTREALANRRGGNGRSGGGGGGGGGGGW